MAPNYIHDDTHGGTINEAPKGALVGLSDSTRNSASNGVAESTPSGLLNGAPNGAPNVNGIGTLNGVHDDHSNDISSDASSDTPVRLLDETIDYALPRDIMENLAEMLRSNSSEVVVILGAGSFGGSTAYWLAKLGLGRVVLVDNADYPNPRAASHDINKIIRDDYPDPLYTRILRHAMPMWRSSKLLSARYHEVGMLRADPTNFCDSGLATKETEGIKHSSRYMTTDEVRQGWNGAFATTNLESIDKVLYNPNAGFAEADMALGDVVRAALKLGVQFIKAEMTSIVFNDNGECIGVELSDGQTIRADKVVLATGARTAELLVRTAPNRTNLHAGDRLLATGAVSFYGRVEGETYDKLKHIPVYKNCLPQVKGEGMSILPNGTIKFNCDLCFTNYITHPVTGEKMSVVPEDDDRNTWTEPPFLTYFMNRARKTMKGLYGDVVDEVPILGYRMCWDASTPTHDFLITPHPQCKGLFVATGGSFHGYKFLPIIGQYVATMLYGVLPDEYADRWAWDKKNNNGESANPTYQVVGDLNQIITGEIAL